MYYQIWSCAAKVPTQGGRIFDLRAVFCILPLAFLFSATTPSLAASASWAATYGGANRDEGHSIQQTSDGGYIVAGGTESFGAGNGDLWVLKLRPDGTVEWQRTYGGESPDGASSIQQTSDGGYVVAGGTKSFGAGNGDFWVLKLGPDGTVEWQRTYGGDKQDAALSIQQTGDGGYIVAGATASFGVEDDYDSWVLKLGHDGTVEWQKTFGGDGWAWAHSVQQTGDGGYVVAGFTDYFITGGSTAWVSKLKSDGTVEWQKTYGGENGDYAKSIRQTDDGGYIVAGSTSSFSAGGTYLWVLKLRPDGTINWQKTYGGIYGSAAFSIRQTGDGGYVVAGRTASPGTGVVETLDLWVLKLRPGGAIEWQKTYGGINWDFANSIQEVNDGGYIVVGETESFGAGNEDIWVLKLRPDGSIDPSCSFEGHTSVSVRDTNTDAESPNVEVKDSSAKALESTAVVQDTSVIENIQCTSTAIEKLHQR